MKTNGEVLAEAFEKAVRDGEVPYQANRRAAKQIDILGNDADGLRELAVMLSGMDVFIADLEAFQRGAEVVAKQSVASVRRT